MSTSSPNSNAREDALQAALARDRETLAVTLARISAAFAAEHLTAAERDAKVAAANARYERAAALAQVEAEFPGWHCWPGVIPSLVYARRPNSSPPIVVRAPDPDGLRKEIERAEGQRHR